MSDFDRSTLELLTSSLGEPQRQSWSEFWPAVEHAEHSLHPVFSLACTFEEEFGEGYTKNPYRGSHHTIPCWTEQDDVVFIEVSFHKGTTFVDLVSYPDADPESMAASLAMLAPAE